MLYRNTTNPADLIRCRAQIGAAEILVCTDGTALFDGGAIFGVVPRTLWSRRISPDSLNRITLGLNCTVVRLGGRTVLIETGFGNKLPPKLRDIYGAEARLLSSLAAASIAPSTIDFVINTHLHWDHCGWNTLLDESGSLAATFPNAQYIAPQGEVAHGRLQLDRDRVSYVPANYEPLLESGQMRLVNIRADERTPVAPGIHLECCPGHTAHMLTVHIESEGERATFVSDLFPTSAHLDPTWVMAFDLDPLRTIAEKKRMLARILPERHLVIFPHDHTVPAATLAALDGRVAVSPVAEAEPF